MVRGGFDQMTNHKAFRLFYWVEVHLRLQGYFQNSKICFCYHGPMALDRTPLAGHAQPNLLVGELTLTSRQTVTQSCKPKIYWG